MWSSYAIPVLIIDVTLVKGLADLGLVLLTEFRIAVKKAVVLLLGVALEFLPGVADVLDYLWRGTAPERSQTLSHEPCH